MSAVLSRRAALSGAVASVAMVGVAVAGAAAVAPAIPAGTVQQWNELVARFRTLASIEAQRLNEYSQRQQLWFDAKSELPARPERPSARFDTGMTLAELRAATDDPAYVAAWAAYGRQDAAWSQGAALREAEIMGDSEAEQQAATDRAVEALAAIRTFPVTSFTMVEEKADIIGRYYGGEFEPHDTVAIVADIRRLNRERVA